MTDTTQNSESYSDGDVVVLKSGGPPMTIQAVRLDGYAFCVWFKDAELLSDAFPCAGLRRVTDEHRAKLRAAHLGRKQSAETIAKRTIALRAAAAKRKATQLEAA